MTSAMCNEQPDGSTENARHETTRHSEKCRGGNCEKWKLRHRTVGVENAKKGNNGTMLQGVENAAHGAMDSQKNIYYEFTKFQPFCANVIQVSRITAHCKSSVI